MSISGSFTFRPGAGELVSVEYDSAPQDRAILCGRLSDEAGVPIADAAVALFLDTMEVPALVAGTVTDRDGQFIFGPLECGQPYVVKIYKNDVDQRLV